jgi:ubiquitin carboxyl-terminal hydrolase 12/46
MGLNRGHYISVVKSNGYWFLFDDEQVEVKKILKHFSQFGLICLNKIFSKKIEVSSFEEFYGLPQDSNKKSETSYILFYEARQ